MKQAKAGNWILVLNTKKCTLNLLRFDAAPLIAFTATNEMNYGTNTDGQIPRGCITLTSGLTRKQVADDLGAEMSTRC